MDADAPRSRAAFLRGMNLGGRRLTNHELVAAVRACGCERVAAHQASGNVVFDDDRGPVRLRAALSSGLEQQLGYPVPVFLRTADDVRGVATTVPFSDEQLAASDSKPQVVFLHGEPSSDVLAEVAALVPEGDVLAPAGRELFWLPAQGVGRSTFDLRRVDELTGGTTVRTLRTVQRLVSRYL